MPHTIATWRALCATSPSTLGACPTESSRTDHNKNCVRELSVGWSMTLRVPDQRVAKIVDILDHE
jgi:hypothetical protein